MPKTKAMWLRALTIAAVLVAWLLVRHRARLSAAHPWLLALLVATPASLMSDFSAMRDDVGGHALYALAALLGLAAMLLLGEGLRREVGLPFRRRRTAALIVLSVLTAVCCGFLPTPRNRTVADVVGASYLLLMLQSLIVAPQRVAAWILGVGIVAYAVSRTALTIAQFLGGDVIALEHLLDTATFAVIGTGIVAFVVDGMLRKRSPASAADEAVSAPPEPVHAQL